MLAKDFYNQVSNKYEDWLKTPEYKVEYLNYAKKMFSKYNISNGGILDVGCGPGNLKTLLGDNFSYTGIDVAENMLDLAKRKGYNIILGRMEEELPKFQDKSFDYVVSLSALHFTKDIQFIISEFERIARKGWIGTFEEITENYINNLAVKEPMYNHSQTEIPNVTEDIFFHAWVSPTTGDNIDARIVFKKL